MEENVIKYYVVCNKLKNLIRKGWIDWHISSDRLESVAEHIYGVEMLAIAMKFEYNYDIDLMKVIMMLAIHELGEIIIGDQTLFDISKEEKEKIEHDAVDKIAYLLNGGNEIRELFLEFDRHETKESIFAYQCDKLECDLMSRMYDLSGYAKLDNLEGIHALENKNVREMIDNGYSLSEMWMKFGQERYPYDDNFMKVSEYARTRNIINL